MSISTTTRKAGPFNGNGVTVAFPFTFKVFTASDLLVVLTDASGNQTTQTLTTQYTVSLNSDQDASPGGTVTMITAPASGATLTIASQVASTQTVKVTNTGGFYPDVFNNAFDKLTILQQQLAETVGRQISFPISDPTLNSQLPSAAARANTALAFDGSGNVIAGALSSTVISAAMTPVVQASTLATGRTALGLGSLATKSIAVTADITDANVTYAKIQNVGAGKILGNYSGAPAAVGELQLDGVTITFNSSYIRPFTPNGARQTVISGPVDSSGLASFGGSTGSTTVTMSGTLVASAAGGADGYGFLDWVGSGTNLSWTGLSTNGTMYLYVDVAGGALTTGSTTLAPAYQWGGTYSTTNGQHTYNIQEMTMKVGNGSTAATVRRVFVGEVTVAGGVVTAITWYALQGRSETAQYGWANSTLYTQSHNIGVRPRLVRTVLVCQTTDAGWQVGDEVDNFFEGNPSGTFMFTAGTDAKTYSLSTGNTAPFVISRSSPGSAVTITLANWKFKTYLDRGW